MDRIILKFGALSVILGVILTSSILLLIPFTSADFVLGNKSNEIKQKYNFGDKIEGWVNLSITNENLSSELSDNFGNKIKLVDLLKSSKISYSCNPSDCMSSYSVQGAGVEAKNINLNNANKEKLVGFKITGESVELTNFKISLSSNAPASCTSQLDIDINDDKKNDWVNENYLLENCGNELKSKCNIGTFGNWILIGEIPYCEKIRLTKSPAFEVKTVIQKESSEEITPFSEGLLEARIYSPDGQILGECNLTEPIGGSISCIVESPAKEAADYYVCVAGKESSGITGYSIQARETGPYCGMYGDPSQTAELSGEYNIVATAKKFDSLESKEIEINETNFALSEGDSLLSYLNTYISDRYQTNCKNGCVIPVKISNSIGITQSVVLNNLNLKYSSISSAGIITKKIYDAAKSDGTVNSNFGKLVNMSAANFTIPEQKNTQDKIWTLYLNSEKIIEKNISFYSSEIINVGSKILGVYPTAIPAMNEVNLIALVDDSINVSEMTFKWNFGDGTTGVGIGIAKIKHSYTTIGNYTIEIKMFKGMGETTSNNFTISVISPKEAIQLTITDYKNKISNIKTRINSLPSAYQEKIKDKVGFTELELKLTELDNLYKQKVLISTTTESDYLELMNSLLAVDVPNSLEKPEKSSGIFITNPENIDVAKIKELFDDDDCPTSDEENCNNLIYSWGYKNINSNIDYTLYSIYYNDKKEDVLSEFTLRFSAKNQNQVDYPVYLVIVADKEKIIFDKDYDISEGDNNVGLTLDLSQGQQIVKFALTEKIAPSGLPIFIAPQLDKLESGPEPQTPADDSWKIYIIIGAILALLIFIFVVYILLQEWYKKNYEKSLFKDKNQLYNLIYFISNAKKQRKTDSEIKSKLRESGWKGEQITYAIDKFAGKRVGMWEIPVFRVKERKKINEEMAKRNSRRVAY